MIIVVGVVCFLLGMFTMLTIVSLCWAGTDDDRGPERDSEENL